MATSLAESRDADDHPFRPLSESELWSGCALKKLAPLEAILFDIDGTLCDSDPIHFCAFRELLQQVHAAARRLLWLCTTAPYLYRFTATPELFALWLG